MKLSHKGIILVLVPVVFEFGFVGSLFYILHQSELELQRAEKARSINDHLHRCHKQQIVLITGLPPCKGAENLHGPERTRLAKSLLLEEISRLRIFVADDPEKVGYVDRMKQSLFEGYEMASDLKVSVRGAVSIETIANLKKSKKLFWNLVGQIDRLWTETETIEEEAPIRLAKNREQLTLLLLAGLAINIAMAIALAIYFSKGTVSRLSVVMDNTKRIAEGKALNPPLSGTDEIADLDRTLAMMAEQREDFAKKEKALLVNAADVICSLDDGGSLTDVSPACQKIWGYAVEEILSMRLNNLVAPDDVESTSREISAARATNTDVSFENRIKSKDGRLVDMLWSVKWSPEEKTFFCVAHDNTERKNAERMKQEFVAMLSHDLRSPLNSVQAFFTMVSDKVYGSLTDKGMAKAASLESTVSWLIEMISDLLDIDKIEAGLSDLDLKLVSLKQITAKAEEALEALAEQESVSIDLPDKDADVFVDEDMFLRVVTNLVSNAIKFSPKGSEVKMEIEKLDQCVELRIIDRGKGVALEDQEVIFERFRQVRGANSGQKRSSGLGLAVSRAIVEQHRGTIGVRSVTGEGSTFWVRLSSVEGRENDVVIV